MKQPCVSIIVPIYNTEKYLRRCMDSLIHQTLQDIEIIMVDDGSKEPCASFCEELAKEDIRIKLIHKQNAGLGMARNTGIEQATGEYIGFVDSDDYIDLTMYEKLYRAAKDHEADLVISGFTFVGGNTFGEEGAVEPKEYFSSDTVFEGKEGMKKLLLGVVGALPKEPDDSRYGVSVCKTICRREVIEKHALRFMSEREILSEDTLFMVNYIGCAEKAVGVPGAYYCYCRNGASLSKSYNSMRFEKSMIFLSVLEERISKEVPKEEYKIYLDRLIQGFGRLLCSQEIVHAKEEKIPYFVLRRRLKEICTREKIAQALKTYPWYRLPIKQAVFAFLMKYRLFLLQKWIVILRDR